MEKCGVYQIRCETTGKLYVGSSVKINTRWSQHRRALRRNVHSSPYLQYAWSVHGESAFTFSILEECERALLAEREQVYVNGLKPQFNAMLTISPRKEPSIEMRAKINATLRARADLITHCPRGHAYDKANTYLNAKGKRICRACNALRVSSVYANETPEQREFRRKRVKDSHEQNRQERLARMREYVAVHKSEKSEYDRVRRERLKKRA